MSILAWRPNMMARNENTIGMQNSPRMPNTSGQRGLAVALGHQCATVGLVPGRRTDGRRRRRRLRSWLRTVPTPVTPDSIIPSAVSSPVTSWTLPVAPSTGMRSRPAAPPRMARTAGTATTTPTRPMRRDGRPAMAMTATSTNASAEQRDVEPARRARRRVARRASACRPRGRSGCRAGCSPPAARTPGSPAMQPASQATAVMRWHTTYAVPAVATSPKNTNTNTSPSPR